MSTPVKLRARGVAAALLERVPSTGARPLAPAPPGSGLAPVMGDPGVPVVGHTLEFLHDGLRHARLYHARFGTVFWLNAVGGRWVQVIGPDALETVLTNRERAFSSKLGWDPLIGPFFDRGVMLMDFEDHRHHRRIMQQAFRHERLLGYLERMNPAIARGIGRWRPGPGFLLYRAAKQLTLDIATETFVGTDLGSEADRLNSAFIDVVAGGQAVIRADVPGGKWHRGLESRRLLERYLYGQLPAKRAGEGDDLFSVLCRAESEDGERFTDEDVVNHMIFTLMAAHDTSTITITMMGYYLARHPEWQERLRDEAHALRKPAIDHADIEALPSLDLVFRETLRMNAPVGVLARQAIKDTEIDGYYIPAGSRLMLGIHPTQRMEPWWRDPDTFDPERFSDARREDASHRYAWAPFGGGVHKCIGMHFGAMEIKAVMHQLLLRYRWRVPGGYEPVMDYGTGPFPGDGLPIELRPL
ncbi:MAG TPA: cytochrome P450 [Solirubrobacteraceae bacterium]|nr:cytochrome P450 [Solirubrobacteraceae bacterium]